MATPTTAGQLTAFLSWVEATKTLNALDRAWPSTVAVPREDTLRERLQWHATEANQLGRVVGVATEIRSEELRLAQLGLRAPDWADDAAVRAHSGLVDAAAAADRLAAARTPLEGLSS